jgi:hypothetical protein
LRKKERLNMKNDALNLISHRHIDAVKQAY